MVFDFFWSVCGSVWGVIVGTFLVYNVVLWVISLGIKIIKKVIS